MAATKKTLDEIVDDIIGTVRNSKEQIFEIGERSRNEYGSLKNELDVIRAKVLATIDQADELELKARLARNRLAEVSRNFQKYTSDEVKAAYEQANEYQVQLALLRQKERQLRQRRDQIERRLVSLKETIERAETLVGQVSVVYNFLTGDLKHVGELVEDAKEKQKFGLMIIEAQEEERKRVARDIHDGPAQMLANVLLRSDVVERVHQDQGFDAALKEIRQLRKLIKESLAEVRRIIYDLRPMALDDLGLVPTIAKYLRTIEERSGLSISFTSAGNIEQRLPTKLEVALFRLVQEAVQNAYKHGKPTEINVKIVMRPDRISIIVKDDGVGFDVKQVKEGSFGLMGMRERINMLKGEMVIDSRIGEGTMIIFHVPNEQSVSVG